MRVGIIGPKQDPQCVHLAQVLRDKGATPLHIQAEALSAQVPHGLWGDAVYYDGERIDDIHAYYLRQIHLAYPPLFQADEKWVLFDDWYPEYMQRLERHSYQISWLLAVEEAGGTVLNPPFAGSVLQYKPYQIQALRRNGIPIPETLVTNDPALVRAFAAAHPEVVFKPSMGGALCHALDEEAMTKLDRLRASPVIFQERIRGDDVRVTVVGDQVVSAVVIETDELDFRADEQYQGGQARYHHVNLPPEIVQASLRAMQLCGLRFSGIDWKRTPNGDWVLLECNSSPIYLDVERKMGDPITAALADHLLAAQQKGAQMPVLPVGMPRLWRSDKG